MQITLFHNNGGVGGGFLLGNCFVALRGDSDTEGYCADLRFVKKITRPDSWAKNFTH